MAGLNRVQLWSSIAKASEVSNSLASRNLRALARAFKSNMQSTGQSMDPPHEITVKPFIEQETGKLVTKVS